MIALTFNRARRAIQREPMPVVVDRRVDIARRLALWLADVAAEAGRTDAVDTTPPADPTESP